ncbi:hypothetical protein J2W17_001882 [Pseudomonas lini]|nr:hypothetical protein [Pseudomonas lini]MDQ0122935.1 hypothetical protein [Pseudomonas lini]
MGIAQTCRDAASVFFSLVKGRKISDWTFEQGVVVSLQIAISGTTGKDI